MTNNRFTSDAFIFTRARGFEPRLPEDLQPLAEQHSIPTDFIPGTYEKCCVWNS